MSSIARGSHGCTRPGRERAHEKLSPAVSIFIFFCGEVTCERRSVPGLFACGLLFTAVVGSADNNKAFVQMHSFERVHTYVWYIHTHTLGKIVRLTLQPPDLSRRSITLVVSCCYSKDYGRFRSGVHVSGIKGTIVHRTGITRTAINSNKG